MDFGGFGWFFDGVCSLALNFSGVFSSALGYFGFLLSQFYFHSSNLFSDF